MKVEYVISLLSGASDARACNLSSRCSPRQERPSRATNRSRSKFRSSLFSTGALTLQRLQQPVSADALHSLLQRFARQCDAVADRNREASWLGSLDPSCFNPVLMTTRMEHQMVGIELARRKAEGKYKGEYATVTHFCGYQGHLTAIAIIRELSLPCCCTYARLQGALGCRRTSTRNTATPSVRHALPHI